MQKIWNSKMINEYQIRVLPQIAGNEQALTAYLSDENGFDARTVTKVRILKRSIDARQRTIYVNLKVRVYINEVPADDEYVHILLMDYELQPSPMLSYLKYM